MAVDVTTVINDARGFAQAMANGAAAQIMVGATALNGINTNNLRISGGSGASGISGIGAGAGAGLKPPVYSGGRFNGSSPPRDGRVPPIANLNVRAEFPSFEAEVPEFIEGLRPGEVREFVEAPPKPVLPVLPEPLNPVLPTAPIISDLSVGPAPNVTPPAFDAVKPNVDIGEAPGDVVEAKYAGFVDQISSRARGDIEAWLNSMYPNFRSNLSRMEDALGRFMSGGTALAPEVEAQIHARAQDRVYAEFASTSENAYAEAAARGFTLPSGSLNRSILNARQKFADNAARTSGEIAIKQAELEQQNVQFAITQSVGLWQSMLSAAVSYHSSLVQMNGQALEAAKAVARNMIDIYNVTLEAAKTKVHIYQVEAEVYQHKLRAAMAALDVYKAQVEGVKAQVDLDEARVRVYAASLQGVNALVEIYKAQIQGVVAEAELEKTKVSIFESQVKAYASEVSANAAAWEGYKALMSGNAAKFSAFGEQARAYSAEVDAYRAAVQAAEAEVNGSAKVAEAQGRSNELALRAYVARIEGESAAVRAEIDSFRASISAFEAASRATTMEAELDLRKVEAEQRLALEFVIAEGKQALGAAQVEVSKAVGISRVAEAAGRGFEGLATAALSGVNTLAAASESKSL